MYGFNSFRSISFCYRRINRTARTKDCAPAYANMEARYLSITGSKSDSEAMDESIRFSRSTVQRMSSAIPKNVNNWLLEVKCKEIVSMFDRVGCRTNILLPL